MASDSPTREPLTGHIKVTRDDWLMAALDVLISDGIDAVKVLALAERLDVSRSSFYWYFRSRQDLLNSLLKHWQSTNTAAMIAQATAPAQTISGAVCNVFRCVIDPGLFNVTLDFAIRDWARRSGRVRRVLDLSDKRRLDALSAMFARHGYAPLEAQTRARVLYFMQIGYDGADLNETLEERLAQVPMYLLVFTGRAPDAAALSDFTAFAASLKMGETA